jgi:hypothetical protein
MGAYATLTGNVRAELAGNPLASWSVRLTIYVLGQSAARSAAGNT